MSQSSRATCVGCSSSQLSDAHFEASQAGRLDATLAEHDPSHSRSRMAALVKQGHVQVNGAVVTRPAAKIQRGDRVRFTVPAPRPTAVVAQDLPLDVVFQDADVVVVNKAAGRVVHPGPGHPDGTLVNALLHHIDDLSGIGGELRPGIVHRLDRGTSGLMVVAKNDQSHRHLAAQFADHSAGRTYLALCVGKPREAAGRIESELGRHPKDRVKFTSVASGKRAVTHWSVREQLGSVVWMECTLETGRTHQIRVHLTERGWPLLGDPLYGKAKPPASIRPLVVAGRPLLHATRLHFTHPSGENLAFEVPPPDDFQAVLRALRGRK